MTPHALPTAHQNLHQLRKPSRQLIAAILAFALATIGGIVILAPPAQADPIIPLTFRISKITQPDDSIDPFPHSPPAEYYAKVTINGVTKSTEDQRFDYPVEIGTGYIFPWVHIPPASWAHSVPVDAALGTASINVELWDDDDFFLDGDDQADISPSGSQSLNLAVNLATGRWTGDVNWPSACTSGDSGDVAEVCFDISTLSTTGDLDGDNLLDGWEQNGFNADGDATIDLDLPAMGADPRRKDLFVEVDCLSDDDNGNGAIDAAEHTHCPPQNAMTDAAQAFANAPVTNPDGTNGVQLHIDTGTLYGPGVTTVAGTAGVNSTVGDHGGGGNQIPENGNEIVDYDGANGNPATNFFTLKDGNLADVREGIYRWALFAHQTNARAAKFDCTSGWAPYEDVLVTLGGQFDSNADGTGDGACWTTDADGSDSVGNRAEQAGTFVHELGHPLELGHGGGDNTNNKPNYLSVMNYSFQMCSVPASPAGAATPQPGGCDLSRYNLALDENALDECVGIAPAAFGFGANDFNGDGTLQGPTCAVPSGTVAVDINGDGAMGVLNGFEDWNSIGYPISNASPGGPGVPPGDPGATPALLQAARAALQAITAPTVNVSVTGPATAIPGEELTYTINQTNTGRGPALKASTVATRPDNSQQVFDLDAILVAASDTREVKYTVPGDACPSTLTTSAKTTYTSFANFPGEATGQAQTQVLDIEAPTLSVAPSKDTLGPPNHKMHTVGFTITVEDNCDPNPAIKLVSVTSSEPDEGLGDGDTVDDIQGDAIGTDDRSIKLRAERAGNGAGRTYTITYSATDYSGNSTLAQTTVKVPHS